MSTLAGKLVDPSGYWLLGIAGKDVVEGLSADLGEFAGAQVHAEGGGEVAALVCEASPRLAWPAALGRDATRREVLPILGALCAVIPFVPARLGTRIASRADAARLANDRGPELARMIDQHANFIQVDIGGQFDREAVYGDLVAGGPFGSLEAQSKAEAGLIARTREQALAGRRAEFEARLRRQTLSLSEEVVELAPPTQTRAAMRRLLIDRGARGELRSVLNGLMTQQTPGLVVEAGVFMPPIDFCLLNIDTADPRAIAEARRALHIEEVTARSSIHVAYRRALERAYPGRKDRSRADKRLARLEQHFRLLDLVAEGQIRAARGERDMSVHLAGDELGATFLIDFAVTHPGRKVA